MIQNQPWLPRQVHRQQEYKEVEEPEPHVGHRQYPAGVHPPRRPPPSDPSNSARKQQEMAKNRREL